MRTIHANMNLLSKLPVILPIVAAILTIFTWTRLPRRTEPSQVQGILQWGELDSLVPNSRRTFDEVVAQEPSRIRINVQVNGNNHQVLLALSTPTLAIKEAISAASGWPIDTFFLTGSRGEIIALSWDSLVDGDTYYLKSHSINEPPNEQTLANGGGIQPAEKRVIQSQLDSLHTDTHISQGEQPLMDGSVRLTKKKARLPRVVVACLGTARYRGIAIAALESAREKFGGDALMSLHLLTDNTSGVDADFNPAFAPYREWPESGLSKFEDILHGIGDVVRAADYFFFMDGDVRFNEDVLLADVAADLTAVEHPFYPRYIMGKCEPDNPNGRGFCGYPYDRNPKSQIQVTDGQGKYFVKVDTTKKGSSIKTHRYIVEANSWYIQSAFWGGKSKHIIAMLEDLSERVNIDRSHKIYSQVVQDERYVNFYLWKHGNDSDLNIRILKPSYLYPFNDHGFGEHISKQARPIIVHGTAKPGKMVKDEAELRIAGTQVCFDNFIKDKIGTYQCHPTSHKGGSQGFIWQKNRIRVAYGKSDHPDAKTCVDGTGVAAGEPLPTGNKCDPNNKGQEWIYDEGTQLMVNKLTGLCIDSMRHDKSMYPEAAKDTKWPVSMEVCGKSPMQKLEISFVSLDESLKSLKK